MSRASEATKATCARLCRQWGPRTAFASCAPLPGLRCMNRTGIVHTVAGVEVHELHRHRAHRRWG
eukprot:355782-Chlamydomonas_euryale.AAC.11